MIQSARLGGLGKASGRSLETIQASKQGLNGFEKDDDAERQFIDMKIHQPVSFPPDQAGC